MIRAAVWWVGRWGPPLAGRVLSTVNAEMDKMDPDNSELRAAFDEWVRREIDQMEQDPARAAELGQAIRRAIGHSTVQAWTWECMVAVAGGAGGRCRQAGRPYRNSAGECGA